MSRDDFAEHVAVNRANWDARPPVSFYDTERYVENPNAISEVVDFDRQTIGAFGAR